MGALELFSPLSQEECVWQLKSHISNRWTAPAGVIVGHVGGRSFWIERRLGYRNSFGTRLRGRFEQAGNGTKIRCRVGVLPLVWVFMAFWFTVVTGVLLVTLASKPAAAAVPLLMLVFGVGLVVVGRRLARGDDDLLVRFVRDCLKARPVEQTAA